MERALAALTGCALLVLLVESPTAAYPVAAAAAGTGYALLLAAVPRRLARRPGHPRAAALYVAVMVPLGYVVFGLGAAGYGATLLLLVLVARAVLLLPLPAAVAVTACVPLVHLGMSWADGTRQVLGTLGAAVFTAVVTELLQREQRARAELAAANDLLRASAAQAEELATARERNRLARDIHDGLGHHLTVVQVQVQAARAVLTGDPARADELLAGAQRQATEALAEVRRSVAALRGPRTVAPLGVALEVLATEASAAGLPTEVEVRGVPRPLSAEAEEALFRAAQEGLTNVRKHAGAGAARVVLDATGDGVVRLEVRDDGRGVPATVPAGAGGFGLLGLRERAARLGGAVDLRPGADGGTTLSLEVPA